MTSHDLILRIYGATSPLHNLRIGPPQPCEDIDGTDQAAVMYRGECVGTLIAIPGNDYFTVDVRVKGQLFTSSFKDLNLAAGYINGLCAATVDTLAEE